MGRPRGIWRTPAARIMSDVEAAWIGAFIEADGSITSYKHCKNCDISYIVITATQMDIEPISTLLRFTGVGVVSWQKMSPFTKFKSINTHIWKWSLRANADVRHVLMQIRPFCPKAQTVLQNLPMTHFERFGGTSH